MFTNEGVLIGGKKLCRNLLLNSVSFKFFYLDHVLKQHEYIAEKKCSLEGGKIFFFRITPRDEYRTLNPPTIKPEMIKGFTLNCFEYQPRMEHRTRIPHPNIVCLSAPRTTKFLSFALR